MNKKNTSLYITFAVGIAAALVFSISKIASLLILLCFTVCRIYMSRASITALKANRAFSQDRREESIALFEKAYNTKGCSIRDKNTYGFVLLKYGDAQKALDVFTSLKKEKLDDQYTYIVNTNYAMTIWRLGRLDEAVALLKDIYATYKTSIVYGTLGSFLIEKGDIEEAYNLTVEAYEYDDEDSVILDNLGQIYFLKGQMDKSKEVFEKLLNKKPRFPEAYYDYSRLCEKLGDKEMALELAKKALDMEFTYLTMINKNTVKGWICYLENK